MKRSFRKFGMDCEEDVADDGSTSSTISTTSMYSIGSASARRVNGSDITRSKKRKKIQFVLSKQMIIVLLTLVLYSALTLLHSSPSSTATSTPMMDLSGWIQTTTTAAATTKIVSTGTSSLPSLDDDDFDDRQSSPEYTTPVSNSFDSTSVVTSASSATSAIDIIVDQYSNNIDTKNNNHDNNNNTHNNKRTLILCGYHKCFFPIQQHFEQSKSVQPHPQPHQNPQFGYIVIQQDHEFEEERDDNDDYHEARMMMKRRYDSMMSSWDLFMELEQRYNTQHEWGVVVDDDHDDNGGNGREAELPPLRLLSMMDEPPQRITLRNATLIQQFQKLKEWKYHSETAQTAVAATTTVNSKVDTSNNKKNRHHHDPHRHDHHHYHHQHHQQHKREHDRHQQRLQRQQANHPQQSLELIVQKQRTAPTPHIVFGTSHGKLKSFWESISIFLDRHVLVRDINTTNQPKQHLQQPSHLQQQENLQRLERFISTVSTELQLAHQLLQDYPCLAYDFQVFIDRHGHMYHFDLDRCYIHYDYNHDHYDHHKNHDHYPKRSGSSASISRTSNRGGIQRYIQRFEKRTAQLMTGLSLYSTRIISFNDERNETRNK